MGFSKTGTYVILLKKFDRISYVNGYPSHTVMVFIFLYMEWESFVGITCWIQPLRLTFVHMSHFVWSLGKLQCHEIFVFSCSMVAYWMLNWRFHLVRLVIVLWRYVVFYCMLGVKYHGTIKSRQICWLNEHHVFSMAAMFFLWIGYSLTIVMFHV